MFINGWTLESVKEHIKANFKGKSITNEGYCKYRGPEGKKCFVGLFIPDDKYNIEMEGRTTFHLFRTYGFSEYSPMSQKEAAIMQEVHDHGLSECDTLEHQLTTLLAALDKLASQAD